MTLTKIVNGEVVALSTQEETDLLAEWAAADPTAPENLKLIKKKLIKRILDNRLSNLDDMSKSVILLARALKIVLKYVTITDQADTDALIALRDEFKKTIDLEDYANALSDSVDVDPSIDVNVGWPI